jgi:hypothetical protein
MRARFLASRVALTSLSRSGRRWQHPRSRRGRHRARQMASPTFRASGSRTVRRRSGGRRPWRTSRFSPDDEVNELKARGDRIFNDGKADAAPGDNFYLTALANPDVYKNPNATGGAEDLIEREFDNRTSLIVDPPDGRIPWTAEGERRRAAAIATGLAATPDGPEDLSNLMRCITFGTPRLGGASPALPAPAASVPWVPNPCSSSSNC